MPGSKHDTQLTAAETNRDYMAEHGATDSDWGAALSSRSREEHRDWHPLFVMLIITISHVSNALHQTLTSYKLVLLIPGHFTCYEEFAGCVLQRLRMGWLQLHSKESLDISTSTF
jgi:hypothetical protein